MHIVWPHSPIFYIIIVKIQFAVVTSGRQGAKEQTEVRITKTDKTQRKTGVLIRATITTRNPWE